MLKSFPRITLVIGLFLCAIPTAFAQDELVCEQGTEDTTYEAYLTKGNEAVAAGEHLQALDLYACAIQIDPEKIEAYQERGWLYLMTLYDNPRAATDYAQLIELQPDVAKWYNNRGLAYYRQQLLSQAISDFNFAIQLNPRYSTPYNNRALAKFDLAPDDETVIDDLRSAKEYGFQPQAVVFSNMAMVHRLRGHYQEAEDFAEQAIAIDNNFAEPYFWLAESLYERGLFNEAIPNYEQHILLAGDQARAKALERINSSRNAQFSRALPVIVLSMIVLGALGVVGYTAYRFWKNVRTPQIVRWQAAVPTEPIPFTEPTDIEPPVVQNRNVPALLLPVVAVVTGVLVYVFARNRK